jgi:hypothetical protein
MSSALKISGMSKIVLIQLTNIEDAFQRVDALFSEGNAAALYSVGDATLLGKVGVLWDQFRDAIREGYLFGKDAVHQAVTNIAHQTEELIKSAGDKAQEAHSYIKLRIQAFIKGLIDGAIKLIPESIEIGSSHYGIVKISYDQKLSLGGSLKANFMEALELTAEGEISIGVEYGKAAE